MPFDRLNPETGTLHDARHTMHVEMLAARHSACREGQVRAPNKVTTPHTLCLRMPHRQSVDVCAGPGDACGVAVGEADLVPHKGLAACAAILTRAGLRCGGTEAAVGHLSQALSAQQQA